MTRANWYRIGGGIAALFIVAAWIFHVAILALMAWGWIVEVPFKVLAR